MNKFYTLLLLLSTFFYSCNNEQNTVDDNNNSITDSTQQDDIMTKKTLDIQGHRGCRGYWPENSIIGFQKAIEMGVHTLEMDVVITGDKTVLVSHEPWMSHETVAQVEHGLVSGDTTYIPIPKENEKIYNIYELFIETIQENYVCGVFPHPRFPEQQQIPVKKPTLEEAIDAAEAHTKKLGLPPIRYNIEIKFTPEGEDIYTPDAEEFTQWVLGVIKIKDVGMRTTIQSFDLECLRVAHRLAPMQTLALLVEDWTLSLEQNLDSLGFTPSILSPYYPLVDEQLMQKTEEQGMKVVPWTVNEEEAIQRLLDLGVDGIISDYPDRVVKLSGLRNE